MPLEKARFLLGTDVFLVQINPISYAINYPKTVEEIYTNVIKGKSVTVNAAHDNPQILSFELVFFSTVNDNAIGNALGRGSNTVQENIDKFVKMAKDSQVAKYNGLTFAWGTLLFHGLLTSFNVNNTMFLENGMPIRASASVTMVETPEPEEIMSSNSSSPFNKFMGIGSKIRSTVNHLTRFLP
ncbi:MAG: hypothetical protein LBJ83_01965 [Oscillospiraceae bacterium]|jgi:hypothetical protein|nr:hypothetical protein [Oscillospiraceae bacterium]